MTEAKKTLHPLAMLPGLLGAAIGWNLAKYCGASLLVPGIASTFLLFLFNRTPLGPRWFAGAINATGSHIIWFTAACAISGEWLVLGPDIAILSIGVLWLWISPSLPAALFLGSVQLVSLGFNAYSLSSATFGDAAHRALTGHCVFRLFAIICLFYGYRRMRIAVSAETAPDPFAHAF